MKADNKRETNGPTATDVARVAGVSTSTVSRVLNAVKADMISVATRQRVIETARLLGYSPNPIARALRGKQTNLLYLIVREISDPFFASFIAVISGQARALGYHIVLGNAHSDPEEALEISHVLDTRHCDGVIVLGDLKDDESALPKILAGNRTAVALCRGQSPAWIPTINVNNSLGIRLLWQHLTGLGHQRFGFIDGGWLGDIRERRQAFAELLENWPLPGIIQAEADELEGGYRAMQSLLRQAERPTAVFAADDMMAIGALQAAQDAGLRVPGDLSLVGFDDIEMANFIRPRLTTIRQPVEEMSRQALNWIMEMITHKDHPLENRLVSVEPRLMIRESSGPASFEQ